MVAKAEPAFSNLPDIPPGNGLWSRIAGELGWIDPATYETPAGSQTKVDNALDQSKAYTDLARTSIVIASSNSRKDGNADIKADGSNDETAFLEAIALANGRPAIYQMLDGEFYFNASVITELLPAYSLFQGMGKGRTIIGGDPGAGSPFFDITAQAGQTQLGLTFRGFTIDGTGVTDPHANVNTSQGFIRDTGAGNVDVIRFEDIDFLAGTQWGTTGICFNNDAGLIRWIQTKNLRIINQGIANYGLQIRKPGMYGWFIDNYIELMGNSGLDAYNAIAIYAGFSGFFVQRNKIKLYRGHSPIASSPACNGTISDNIIEIIQGEAGEAGIEIQLKLGHGGDATTSHDIVVHSNVVKGGYYNIIVDNEADATNPAQRPYNIKVFDNQCSGAVSGVDTYLKHGDHGVSAWNTGVLQQDSTCVGTIDASSVLAGIVGIKGGGRSRVYTLTISGNPTGGTFKLLFGGVASTVIPFNPTVVQIQAALDGIPSLGPGTTLVAGAGNVFTITFINQFASVPFPSAFTSDSTGLTGGVAPAAGLVLTTTALPAAPVPLTAFLADGNLYLPNGGTIYIGNQAGTTFVSTLTRDKNNEVQIRGGGDGPAIHIDTAQRIGIGYGNIHPSVVDGLTSSISIFNAISGGATRLTIKAGDTQGLNELLRFLDNAGNKLYAIGSTGFIEMKEQADPAAPAADTARLYSRDNGAGKTQLCVLFPTGAVQVLATQL